MAEAPTPEDLPVDDADLESAGGAMGEPEPPIAGSLEDLKKLR